MNLKTTNQFLSHGIRLLLSGAVLFLINISPFFTSAQSPIANFGSLIQQTETSAVPATTYTVTNTTDSATDTGSLRYAVDQANASATDDTINFNIAGCPNNVCTITLSGELPINATSTAGKLTITNSTGASKMLISGNDKSRVFFVKDGADFTLNGVTVTKGNGIGTTNINYSGYGGGIIAAPDSVSATNLTNLTIINSIIDNNSSSFYGGGVWTGSIILTIKDSTISNNKAVRSGGGIYASGGTMSLIGSTVSNNSTTQSASGGISDLGGGGIYKIGNTMMITSSVINNNIMNQTDGASGGIYNFKSAVTITDSIINNNISKGSSGGIKNDTGTLTITGSTVNGNIANGNAGGIGNYFSTMTVTFSTINGNTANNGSNGGGVYNSGSSANGNILTITNSTVSNNTSSRAGGGVHNDSGTVRLNNSTLSGNTTKFNGGGIFNYASITITNSTISGNTSQNGGGINNVSLSSTTTSIRNSIVATNTGTSGQPDINHGSADTFTSNGNNLIGKAANSADTGTTVNWQMSDILNQSPRLSPLGNNGGTTQTQALLSGSPAVNAGNNCVLTANGCGDGNAALTTDQRGASRVGNVDIGAFELNNSANGGNFRVTLPNGKQTFAYNTTLASYDDAKFPNFTYAVTNGALPPGISLTKTASFIAATQTVAFTGTPTQSGLYNFTVTTSDGTNTNATDYAIGIQNPTAANVTVGGLVLTANGRGLMNANVLLTDSNGATRYARTSISGRFSFAEVAAGDVYILSVNAKRYQFEAQALNLTGSTNKITFRAIR